MVLVRGHQDLGSRSLGALTQCLPEPLRQSEIVLYTFRAVFCDSLMLEHLAGHYSW